MAGVPRCGSATCEAAAGNVEGGAAFTFWGMGSESVTVCVSSKSAGVLGGGRAMSWAGATTGPFRTHEAMSING